VAYRSSRDKGRGQRKGKRQDGGKQGAREKRRDGREWREGMEGMTEGREGRRGRMRGNLAPTIISKSRRLCPHYHTARQDLCVNSRDLFFDSL